MSARSLAARCTLKCTFGGRAPARQRALAARAVTAAPAADPPSSQPPRHRLPPQALLIVDANQMFVDKMSQLRAARAALTAQLSAHLASRDAAAVAAGGALPAAPGVADESLTRLLEEMESLIKGERVAFMLAAQQMRCLVEPAQVRVCPGGGSSFARRSLCCLRAAASRPLPL